MAQKYSYRVGRTTKKRRFTPSRQRRAAKRALTFGKRRSIARSLLNAGDTFKFRRHAFDQNVNFATDVNGQLFGSIQCNGITSINYLVGSVNMPNLTEFTTLFDQYKLLTFTVEFRPRFSEAPVNLVLLPTMYWIHDKDDATAITASQMMEHARVRSQRMNRPVFITVKFPTIMQPVYQSAVSTSYAPRKTIWLDMANSSVPHYGVKYFIQGGASTSYTFDVRVHWTFLCKHQR